LVVLAVLLLVLLAASVDVRDAAKGDA